MFVSLFKTAPYMLIFVLDKDVLFHNDKPEAVFLVVCDPSLNEL
jgi:hypothetical protein